MKLNINDFPYGIKQLNRLNQAENNLMYRARYINNRIIDLPSGYELSRDYPQLFPNHEGIKYSQVIQNIKQTKMDINRVNEILKLIPNDIQHVHISQYNIALTFQLPISISVNDYLKKANNKRVNIYIKKINDNHEEVEIKARTLEKVSNNK